MKRLAIIAATCVLGLTLTACNDKDNKPADSKTTVVVPADSKTTVVTPGDTTVKTDEAPKQ